MDDGYREVLGSDVPNDGMYIELRNQSDTIIACVFRSDATGAFEITLGPGSAPQNTIDRFVLRAKTVLQARSA